MKRMLCMALAVSLIPSLAVAGGLFECEEVGDGAWRVIITEADPDTATAIYKLGLDSGGGESSAYTLAREVSGSGFRYRGEGLEFVGKGEEGTLVDGAETMRCSLVPDWMMQESMPLGAQDEDAQAQGAVAGSPARALGGNIRSGPGTQHQRLGALGKGVPITLQEDTGVELDGYRWFVIRQADGETGYVWGGIICAVEADVPGLIGICE